MIPSIPKKEIISGFGLQVVETAIYAGVIKSLGGNIPDDPIAYSALGTPVWDTLWIEAGEYEDTQAGKVKFNEMRIDSALITISQTNNVILTPIQGKDGEVIEYVSKMSFRINVKGGVFSNNNRRPVSDIANLMLMLKSNSTLKIKSCKFLEEWEIDQFVILDKNIPQVAGGYNFQLFEFNAIQDVPVVLAQQVNV